MTSIPHQPPEVVREKPGWSQQLRTREAWAWLAIIVMWLSVLFDAVFGRDIVSRGVPGEGDSTSVPSAVAVAPFAFLGTWMVARYGLGRTRGE